jgi:hypothetical protein
MNTKRLQTKLFLLTFILLSMVTASAFAQQARKVSWQGFLRDANGKAVADGPQEITFKLYTTPTDGTAAWTDTQTINVFGGVCSTHLGSVANPIDALNWGTTTYYIGVTLQGIELSPRTELTFAPYSIGSPKAQEVVCSGAVGDVKYSVLNPTQFAAVNGSCWVPMDGRSMTNSKLATITGTSTVANAGGAFLRGQDTNGSNSDPDKAENAPVATLQVDTLGTHSHSLSGATTRDQYLSRLVQSTSGEESSNKNWLHGEEPEVLNNSNNTVRKTLERTQSRGIVSDESISLEITNTRIQRSHLVSDISTDYTGHTETRPINVNLYTYVRIN